MKFRNCLFALCAFATVASGLIIARAATPRALQEEYQKERLAALADSLNAHKLEVTDFIARPLAEINPDSLALLNAMLHKTTLDKTWATLIKRSDALCTFFAEQQKSGPLLGMPYFQTDLVGAYKTFKGIDKTGMKQEKEMNEYMYLFRDYAEKWVPFQSMAEKFAKKVEANAAQYSPEGVKVGSAQKKEAFAMLDTILRADTTIIPENVQAYPLLREMWQTLEKGAKSNPLILNADQQTVMAIVKMYKYFDDYTDAQKYAAANPRLSEWDDLKKTAIEKGEVEVKARATRAEKEMNRRLMAGREEWLQAKIPAWVAEQRKKIAGPVTALKPSALQELQKEIAALGTKNASLDSLQQEIDDKSAILHKIEELKSPLNRPYNAAALERSITQARELSSKLGAEDSLVVARTVIAPAEAYPQGLALFGEIIDEVNSNKLVKFYRSNPGTSDAQANVSIAKLKEVIIKSTNNHKGDVMQYIQPVPYLNEKWKEYLNYTPPVEKIKDDTGKEIILPFKISPTEEIILSLQSLITNH